MGIHGDLTGSNDVLWRSNGIFVGFHGDLMGFDRISWKFVMNPKIA